MKICLEIAQLVGLMNQVMDMAQGLENYMPDEVLQIKVGIHEPQFGGFMRTTYEFPKEPKFTKEYQEKSAIYPFNKN